MKPIAIFCDEKGQTVPIDSKGQFVIYKKEEQGWQEKEVIPYGMDPEKGIGGIRQELKTLADRLQGCSSIVAAKVSGLPYTVLEPMGFEFWEVEGTGTDLLEEIQKAVESIAAESEGDFEITPKMLDDEGHYYLDLKGAMKMTKGTKSSKQILLPFLEKADFYELKVLCDHIPPWFDKKFPAMGLKHEVIDRGQGDKTAVIRDMTCCD